VKITGINVSRSIHNRRADFQLKNLCMSTIQSVYLLKVVIFGEPSFFPAACHSNLFQLLLILYLFGNINRLYFLRRFHHLLLLLLLVGYGYIYPVTTAGRVITMVYALIGIPLCMVVLAGLGKSLTRAIKYFWSFVRRFYYTGSFRRVRSVIPLSRVRLTFCQRMFNRLRRRLLTRRRQQTIRAAAVTTTPDAAAVESTVVAAVDAELECLRELDETFVPYEVDDKFDLPPIIALVIAFLYILLGAFIYTRWEDWTYFEAFYFTFISLCTIGFGDVVPDHPKNLMATGVYLVFGLALIAMVVNVVMEAVDSTIARAKDGVRDVGRRIVDVAQRQTVASLQQQVASTAQSQLQWVNATARSSARRHSI